MGVHDGRDQAGSARSVYGTEGAGEGRMRPALTRDAPEAETAQRSFLLLYRVGAPIVEHARWSCVDEAGTRRVRPGGQQRRSPRARGTVGEEHTSFATCEVRQGRESALWTRHTDRRMCTYSSDGRLYCGRAGGSPGVPWPEGGRRSSSTAASRDNLESSVSILQRQQSSVDISGSQRQQ